jgi:hypothetical protein
VFPAAHVWWFSVLAWGSGALVWATPLVVYTQAPGPISLVVLHVCCFLGGWLAGPWFWLTTRYAISVGHLTLHSGPFRLRLQLDKIEEVTPERKGMGVSFATHTDFLWVGYPMRGGGALISPAEKALFLTELARSCPHLVHRSDRLERREPRSTTYDNGADPREAGSRAPIDLSTRRR